jgi:hypothetical protein
MTHLAYFNYFSDIGRKDGGAFPRLRWRSFGATPRSRSAARIIDSVSHRDSLADVQGACSANMLRGIKPQSHTAAA